jgi:hypothetical protein
MATKQIKTQIPKRAIRTDRARAGAAPRRNGASAAAGVRGMGQRLLDSSSRFAGKTATQARNHPFALVGAVVTAGLVVAGALWRRAVGR